MRRQAREEGHVTTKGRRCSDVPASHTMLKTASRSSGGKDLPPAAWRKHGGTADTLNSDRRPPGL